VEIAGRNEPFIQLGTVVRPHGIRGELKVRPCTERPENICQYRRFFLAADDLGEMMACSNAQTRVNGASVILKLEECTDRNQAEQLVGLHLWVAASDLPPAGPGEFYLHTLIGKRARSVDGQVLGIVRRILGGAQDILVIQDGESEFLVPAVRVFITAMGPSEVVLDLPPGLLEINR
jgi:16S rRNA processing protein RimM